MAAVATINMQPFDAVSSKRRSPSLSIDLSDLPQLSQPSPPSNTLLVTNLQSLEIFTGAVLDNIQRAISAQAPIHTFAPLKSFRRLVISFFSTDDAIKVRQMLDGETVLGSRVRVYFGQPTPIDVGDQHLQAPQSQKLFFISPPPSPPMGWEMRNEEPPNKAVHADDLAAALANLHARPAADEALRQPQGTAEEVAAHVLANRQRAGSSSTFVYHPETFGHSPDLPVIAVEDTSESPGQLTPMEGVERKFHHTSRPPVELMES